MPPKRPAKSPVAKRPAKKATPGKAAPKKTAPRTAKKAPAREAASRGAAPKKAAAKKPPARRAAAPAARPAFGRPGTAGKAEGDAAVRAWIQGVDARHRPVVERLDALIAEVVPDVKRSVKWSMPMYGREGMGIFAHVGAFKEHVRLGFFAGAELQPQPPMGESKGMRSVHLRGMGDFDEPRFRAWIQQAASIKGWGKA